MTPDIVRDPPRRGHIALACDESDLAAVVAALREVAEALHVLAEHAPRDPHRLFRAEEVAELLQLPVRTVRDRAAAGAIPHRRFGKHYRFSVADVERIVGSMERLPRQRQRRPGPLRAAA